MSSVLYDSLQSRGHPLSANCGRPDQLCFVESVVTVTNTQQCISKCVNEVLSENTPVDNPPYKPPVEILYQTENTPVDNPPYKPPVEITYQTENTPVDNRPYKPPVEILYQTMLLFQCETNDDPILVNMYTQYQEALGNRKCKYAR
jgi:hypothetical protein